ncbi:MAG TPA: SAM-dependent methyltransferase [Gammaproteobacteria bacterium]|nr:hypothetical protein [Xanthomonadales bacterium]MCB1593473.1 hypothetical protein [Xanthomonadales bacterium]HPI96345.1 SAM-dependent methyltransferase [Gammaproteobacteria bacterium]HPQ87759.1 SAM-dependent methyltransferase [Gammaproteobacteria bacterium]
MKHKGKLVNVGLGMTLGAHITPISRNYIEKADVVFVAASNNLVEHWVKEMNPDVRSLQKYYQEGISRMKTYRKMVEAILSEVRLGKNVCGAFYGHPGVFAWAPHESIRQAKAEGFQAHMEPGISAEDCLYADLGIDPGRFGCTHLEASQFMFRNKSIDSTSYLILWQVGIAGDKSLSKFSTPKEYKKVLVDILLKTYPADFKIILYECAVLPIEHTFIKEINVSDLQDTAISLKTTVVFPPLHKTTLNDDIIKQVEKLK